jgi:hypothetical protein
MMEHLEFWTSSDCPPMSLEDLDLVKRLAEVVGVKIYTRLSMEKEPCVRSQAPVFAGMN